MVASKPVLRYSVVQERETKEPPPVVASKPALRYSEGQRDKGTSAGGG